VQSLSLAKPKLFFKHISCYAATSKYIHVQMAFNFTIVFNTQEHIAQVYSQLEDKHEGPFIAITKSLTEVSLMTIKSSLEDFHDIIKALPQMMEISMPGRPKRFIALGILIVAMVDNT